MPTLTALLHRPLFAQHRLPIGVALAVASFALSIASDTLAQSQSPTSAQSNDDAQALRGPAVPLEPTKNTLIERAFDGKLKRPETDPVLAALSRLELDAPTREAVDTVIAQRNAVVDRLVLDNLSDIVNLAQARQSGNKAELRSALTALYAKAQPLLTRPRLLDELRPVLPSEKFSELSRIVSDYYKLAIKERLEEPGPIAKSPGSSGAVAAELLNTFGQELKRSYDRVFTSRKDEFEALLKSLTLSPEQDAKVHQIVIDLIQKTQGKPTRQQLARAYLDVYQQLDAEQRRLLTARAFEDRKLERGILAWRRRPTPTSTPAPDAPASSATPAAASPMMSAPANK